MNVDVSLEVAQWAGTYSYEITQGSQARDGRTVLYSRGGELRIFVGTRSDGWIAVTESERMGTEQLTFAATSVKVVECYLVNYFGRSIRSARKLPRLRRPHDLSEIALGFGLETVSLDGRTHACLMSSDGQMLALSAAGELLATSELIELSSLISIPIAAITKAFLSETGSPVFTLRSPRDNPSQ